MKNVLFKLLGVLLFLAVAFYLFYEQQEIIATKREQLEQIALERQHIQKEREEELENQYTTWAEFQKTLSSQHAIIPEDSLDFQPYNVSDRHAIVTMIGYHGYQNAYWLGAVALIQSLREVKTRVPNIIVFVRVKRKYVPEHAITALENLGAKLVWTDDIAKASFLQIPGTWGNAWTKLKVWTLTEYDKVLFLDADTMMVNNNDHLLELPELSAPYTPYSCSCTPPYNSFFKEYYTISSGFFVCKPSMDTYLTMMELASKPSPDPKDLEQFNGTWHWGDQEMLKVVFDQLGEINPWHPLSGLQYDTPIGLCDCEDRTYLSRSYHFTCLYPIPKPWAAKFDEITAPSVKPCLQQLLLLWYRLLARGLGYGIVERMLVNGTLLF